MLIRLHNQSELPFLFPTVVLCAENDDVGISLKTECVTHTRCVLRVRFGRKRSERISPRSGSPIAHLSPRFSCCCGRRRSVAFVSHYNHRCEPPLPSIGAQQYTRTVAIVRSPPAAHSARHHESRRAAITSRRRRRACAKVCLYRQLSSRVVV